MTENLKNFLKFVGSNEEIQKKAKELKSENPEEAKEIAIAFAAENGFELTEADFDAPEGELSERELSDVAGGGDDWNGCFCPLVGGGGGEDDDDETFGCACVGYGQGGDANDDNWQCICVVSGAGEGTWW